MYSLWAQLLEQLPGLDITKAVNRPPVPHRLPAFDGILRLKELLGQLKPEETVFCIADDITYFTSRLKTAAEAWGISEDLVLLVNWVDCAFKLLLTVPGGISRRLAELANHPVLDIVKEKALPIRSAGEFTAKLQERLGLQV